MDLSENWAAKNYSGPDRGGRLIASVGRVYYRPRRVRGGIANCGQSLIYPIALSYVVVHFLTNVCLLLMC